MKLKVLSWNIWIDSNFNEVANFLKASQADVIGLQEVQADDTERDVIGLLTKLGYGHVFAPVRKESETRIVNDGPALFSRYKIVNSQTYILSEKDSRAAVSADIEIGNKSLHAFCVHLIHTHQTHSKQQDEQVASLIAKLPLGNTVVTGDFNATEQSTVINSMRKVLVDSDPSCAPTWSNYPEGCDICKPRELDIRLDYIFTSKDIKTSSFKVERSKASDHSPISVLVDF